MLNNIDLSILSKYIHTTPQIVWPKIITTQNYNDNKDNNKTTWNKHLTGKRKYVINLINSLIVDHTYIANPQNITETLPEYFANVWSSQAKPFPSDNACATDYMQTQYSANTIFLYRTDEI